MASGEIHHFETDVAVIGGGTAGLNTAMAAVEKGCSVLVVDKAHIRHSGAIGGGIDHFMAYLDEGEAWDTRESYLSYVGTVSRGASNLDIHQAVFCDELTAAIDRIESIGVSMRLPGRNDIFRTQAMGQPGPYFINFDGKQLKPMMAKEVSRRRCKVLNRVQVTKLFLHDGVMSGFVGFNVRTGDFYVVHAKAVVVATGNTNRMFKAQTGNPFNLWYCPANTGDLHRACWDIGVELANMEYVRMTIVPKGFSAPGFNAFFGMGAKLVNSLVEPFMKNYHPMGDKAPRNYMAWGALQELKAGRGPIYMDCRHLEKRDLEHLFSTLGIDKDTLPEFFIAKGYNIAGTLIEMTVSEPMQARPSELCGAGIKIDETCASNVPGLFAAGDASDQMGCLHMCVAGGFAAGKHAAEYALGSRNPAPISTHDIEAERARVFAPLGRNTGLPYWEFENIVRIVTTDHFGPVKTERSLTAALDKLDALDSAREQLSASNMHELMRVHEAMNIQEVAKIMASASLVRKESRFTPYHYRADFPETDDENWCGLVVVKKGSDGRATSRFERLAYTV